MKKSPSTATVDPRNARSKKYKSVLADVIAQGVCPFCPQTFKWHTKPILRRSRGWLITENMHPYPNSKFHFLIIGRQHNERLSELAAEDLESILNLANWAIRRFSILGGGITLRFGDTLYTGATVKHLHAHLIVPEVKKDKTLAVNFPIG